MPSPRRDEAECFFPLVRAALRIDRLVAFGHSVGGAMAAVINAVADATGSPVSRIPFRAVDVLESIGRGAR